MSDLVCPFCKVAVLSHDGEECLDAWMALSILRKSVHAKEVHVGDTTIVRTEYEAFPPDLESALPLTIRSYSRDANAIQDILVAALVGSLAFASRVALSLREGEGTDPNDLIWEARFRPVTDERGPEWWAATAPTLPLAVARAALIAREAT